MGSTRILLQGSPHVARKLLIQSWYLHGQRMGRRRHAKVFPPEAAYWHEFCKCQTCRYASPDAATAQRPAAWHVWTGLQHAGCAGMKAHSTSSARLQGHMWAAHCSPGASQMSRGVCPPELAHGGWLALHARGDLLEGLVNAVEGARAPAEVRRRVVLPHHLRKQSPCLCPNR